MSARSPWTHRQVESDLAEHRGTVLVHLVGITRGPQVCAATSLAALRPELSADRWAAVLERMTRMGEDRRSPHTGLSIRPARLLHPVDRGQDPQYALTSDGWAAARRLTGGQATERGAA